MASCTAAATSSASRIVNHSTKPSLSSRSQLLSFSGLRTANKIDSLSCSSTFDSKTRFARSLARTTCLETAIIISISTATSLALGRFVFLPFQREQVAKAGLPLQNGVSHFEAGDKRAQEVSGLLKTNDPAGFTIVDVLAWGSIGHIVAYWILATSSNGYEPQF